MKRIARVLIVLMLLYINYMFNYAVINHLYNQHIVLRVNNYEHDIILMVLVNAVTIVLLGYAIYNAVRKW